MDLYEFFSSKQIAGIDFGLLKSILQSSVPEVVADVKGPGIILLHDMREGKPLDHKIIRCVEEYYSPADTPGKMKLSTQGNPFLKCNRVKKMLFGDDDSSVTRDCCYCHLHCMQLEQTGAIHRFYKHKSDSKKKE